MDLKTWSDAELRASLKRLVQAESELLGDVLDHLIEYDRRKLAIRDGFPSLWKYCVEELGYSEGEAWNRIAAARASNDHPRLLDQIKQGNIRLFAATRLSSHLTQDNSETILTRAAGLTTRQAENLIAEIAPRGDIKDHVQILPSAYAPLQGSPALPSPPQSITPLSPERVHFGFTASKELREKLDRAKELLSHKFPKGRLENIIDLALEDLLEKRDPLRRIARRERRKRQGSK